MQAAARTLALHEDAWLIVSGGPTRGTETEAAVMAHYATIQLGVDPQRIELEPLARSTWDNVRHAIPLIRAGNAEQIAFVSHPFHVERARRYLQRQEPELASCVVRATGIRPLEQPRLVPLLYLHHLVRRICDRRFERIETSVS